jgi:hypothetical protein
VKLLDKIGFHKNLYKYLAIVHQSLREREADIQKLELVISVVLRHKWLAQPLACEPKMRHNQYVRGVDKVSHIES